MQRIDSEKLIDEVVRVVGGQRVRELVGENPPFDNADYLFTKDNIISELKDLEKDFLSDPTVNDRMQEMYNRWLDEGKEIPTMYGEGVLQTDQIPVECARKLMGIFQDKLESAVLRKANRQIRETKEKLNYPNALGLLLLSNEGNFVFDPEMTAHVLFHSLGAKFSSIEHVILVSANLRITASTMAPMGPPFISIRCPNRRQPSDEFIQRLGSSWYGVLGAATGRKFAPFRPTTSAPADIARLRFLS